MESVLMQIIDYLRMKMVETAMEKGSFVDDQVIDLSQQLDFFIYQQQLLKDKKRKMYLMGIVPFLDPREQVYAVS